MNVPAGITPAHLSMLLGAARSSNKRVLVFIGSQDARRRNRMSKDRQPGRRAESDTLEKLKRAEKLVKIGWFRLQRINQHPNGHRTYDGKQDVYKEYWFEITPDGEAAFEEFWRSDRFIFLRGIFAVAVKKEELEDIGEFLARRRGVI